MSSPVPSHHGTYREITAALSDRIAAARAARGGFREWLASPVEIVIPSRGVADAIVAALIERMPAGVTGVHLRTLDTLAAAIVNRAGEFPRVAADDEQGLAMQTVAASIDDPLMENRGIAGLLLRSYRDIRDSGATIAAYRAANRQLRNRERVAILGEAFARYERQIALAGAIDPADLIERASSLAGRSPLAPQILFGFYDATGIQRRLIDALARAGKIDSVYIPIPAGAGPAYRFGSGFAVSGAEPQPGTRNPEPGTPTTSIRQFATRHVELREVCRSVATLLQRNVRPDDIGIVARAVDPHEARLLERLAAEFGFAVSPRVGTPLAAHPIGRAVALILRLRERDFPRSEVLEIVRTGWNVRVENGHPNRLDSATRDHQIAGGGSDSLGRVLDRSTRSTDEIRAYKAIVETLEALTVPLVRPMRGDAWRDHLLRILELFRAESESDLDALEALDRVARLLGNPPFRNAAFSPAAVERAIENAGDLPTRGNASLPLVWFGDVMKLRGRSFAHLLAYGIEQGRFPQERTEDALVPNADRRALGVREIDDGAAEEELLFELLLGSATASIALSFATRDASGKEARASYFLKSLAQRLDPEREREIVRDFSAYLREQPAAAGVASAAERHVEELLAGTAPVDAAFSRRLRLTAETRRRSAFDGYLTATPELADAIRAKIGEISPTDLEHYGECPQRFLLRKLFGVRELEDPEHEVQIDRRKKGSLDHRILERFYSQLRPEEIGGGTIGRALAPALAARLRSVIEEEFARHNLESPPVNPIMRGIEKDYTFAILEEFVAADLFDLAERGFIPRHFEYKFGIAGEPVPAYSIAPAGVPVAIRGKIDRIDVKGDPPEKVRIIDYKSGKALKQQGLAGNIDAGHSLQLALYAIAYGSIAKLPDSAIQGVIKPIRIQGLKEEDYSFELAEKRQQVDAHLELFLDAIVRGVFPAFPDKYCEYCAVAASCRTRHDARETQALAEFGNAMTLLRQQATGNRQQPPDNGQRTTDNGAGG